MIQVSNEFKKAIKSPERRIKGYVEVLYDLPSVGVTATTNINSSYTDISEVINGNRVTNKYGTLDYLPLDGSYITMDTTENANSGFISDGLGYENFNKKITLTFDSPTEIKGVTIYCDNNVPYETTYKFSDNTTITKQGSEQLILESPKTTTYVELTFNNWSYGERKVRIDEIDLGITQVYKDQDLIEFTVDEEVNKLVEEVPINETNIVLNNMTDLFNPLNPSGIVPYLSENTLIKPYIGVQTENLGVEYVKMGEFYFDSYTNNSDATTILVGKNIVKQLQTAELTDGLVGLTSSFIDLKNGTSPNLTTDILSRLGYQHEFNPRTRIAYYLHFLDDINLMNYLKDVTIHDYSIFYGDRQNKLIIRDPQTPIRDTLTKQELINDAEYKKIDKINTIIKNDDRVSSEDENKSGSNTTIFSNQNAEFVMTKSPQNFAIKNEAPRDVWALNMDVNFTYTGASSAEIKCGSNHYTIVQARGAIGSTVSFNCIYQNHTLSANNIGQDYEITNRKNTEKRIAMEIKSTLNAYPGRVRTDLGLLEYTPSYEMSFDYNGDPSLEAGDYINVETPYGYKKLFIQKNRFKFDGGLEGSIEGVE